VLRIKTLITESQNHRIVGVGIKKIARPTGFPLIQGHHCPYEPKLQEDSSDSRVGERSWPDLQTKGRDKHHPSSSSPRDATALD